MSPARGTSGVLLGEIVVTTKTKAELISQAHNLSKQIGENPDLSSLPHGRLPIERDLKADIEKAVEALVALSSTVDDKDVIGQALEEVANGTQVSATATDEDKRSIEEKRKHLTGKAFACWHRLREHAPKVLPDSMPAQERSLGKMLRSLDISTLEEIALQLHTLAEEHVPRPNESLVAEIVRNLADPVVVARLSQDMRGMVEEVSVFRTDDISSRKKAVRKMELAAAEKLAGALRSTAHIVVIEELRAANAKVEGAQKRATETAPEHPDNEPDTTKEHILRLPKRRKISCNQSESLRSETGQSPEGGTEKGVPEMDEATKQKLDEILQRIDALEKNSLTKDAMKEEVAKENKRMEALMAEEVKKIGDQVAVAFKHSEERAEELKKKEKEQKPAKDQKVVTEQAAGRRRATVGFKKWIWVASLIVFVIFAIAAASYGVYVLGQLSRNTALQPTVQQQQQVEQEEALPAFDF